MTAQHPGFFIRQFLSIPNKLSVTKAARRCDICRVHFSNIINGKKSATAETALKLQNAFGIPAQKILELQAAYEAEQCVNSHSGHSGRGSTPILHRVLSTEIAQWFTENHPARYQLPVFIRILIRSTGKGIREANFPGYNEAERPGWDGTVDSEECTEWIPQGRSLWELGTSSSPKSKADSDFKKRIDKTPPAEQAAATFVFVTNRRWLGKDKWIEEKKLHSHWKDIRVLDSSDLEQWTETSPVAQAWFREISHSDTKGVRTLEQCWAEWAEASDPALLPALFEEPRLRWKKTLAAFLEKDLPAHMTITAASPLEALAFLAATLEANHPREKDRCLVFDSDDLLPRLNCGNPDVIVITHTPEMEKALIPISKRVRCIYIRAEHQSQGEPDISLTPLSVPAFSSALEKMGKSFSEIGQLATASGRSLTVLRRRLSLNPRVQNPDWANSEQLARSLVPMALAGVWAESNPSDADALADLSGKPYEQFEETFASLWNLSDSPVWATGTLRGVVSQMDALFAAAGYATSAQLERFYKTMGKVFTRGLTAAGPVPEIPWGIIPQSQRHLHSDELREALGHTLVLLSVYGNELFGKRMHFDGEIKARDLVASVLSPLTAEKLATQGDMLAFYAEACPAFFLGLIESDLDKPQSAIIELMHPTEPHFLFTPPRIALLRALECLAWNPEFFPKVVRILGRLSEETLSDNYANTPLDSLINIFQSWMPQTSASETDRIRAVRYLLERHRATGWKVCLSNFANPGRAVGEFTCRPQYRSLEASAGEPFPTWGPYLTFARAMTDLALSLPYHTTEELIDLVRQFRFLKSKDQKAVCRIISRWGKSCPEITEAKRLQKAIFHSVLSASAKQHDLGSVSGQALSAMQKLHDELVPKNNLFAKHEWLFESELLVECPEIPATCERDPRQAEQHLWTLRKQALGVIYGKHGVSGILRIAESGAAGTSIGRICAGGLVPPNEYRDLITAALAGQDEHPNFRALLAAFLGSLSTQDRDAVICSLAEDLGENYTVRLLCLCPYRATTWRLAQQLGSQIQSRYWQETAAHAIFESIEEHSEGLRHLLDCGRCWAALEAASLRIQQTDARLLMRILSDCLQPAKDEPSNELPTGYWIDQLFARINEDESIPYEKKAELEFGYARFLAFPAPMKRKNKIPNLERLIEEHPHVYAQLVMGMKSSEEQSADPLEKAKQKARADACRTILHALDRIPGLDRPDDGEQFRALKKWSDAVRCVFLNDDRMLSIADLMLGELLSHAPRGKDGVWPCHAVRDLAEELKSNRICHGLCIGRHNARGGFVRSMTEGGEQELAMAREYRTWAKALDFSHPYIARNVLEKLAETLEKEAKSADEDTEMWLRRAK